MRSAALIENHEEEVTVDAFADLAKRIEEKDARRRQRLLYASRIDQEPSEQRRSA